MFRFFGALSQKAVRFSPLPFRIRAAPRFREPLPGGRRGKLQRTAAGGKRSVSHREIWAICPGRRRPISPLTSSLEHWADSLPSSGITGSRQALPEGFFAPDTLKRRKIPEQAFSETSQKLIVLFRTSVTCVCCSFPACRGKRIDTAAKICYPYNKIP